MGAASERIERLIVSSAEIEDLTRSNWEKIPLGKLLERVRREAVVNDEKIYKQITVKLYGKGVIERGTLRGADIKTRPQLLAHAGDLIMSRIDARSGAFGIIPESLNDALVTQDFPMFRIDPSQILSEYLALLLKSGQFTEICRRASRGTTNRKRLNEALLLAESIPLPPKDVQQRLLTFANEASKASTDAKTVADAADDIERNVCNLMLHL
jgi:restriction endonuclease S subunit